MAFQLSPGVLVTEEDRTTIVPSVATTAGAMAGAFQWGPVDEVTTVESENNLVENFGRPDDQTASYFFTAANFLSYGNNLQLIRVIDRAAAKNAVSNPSGTVTGVTITNTPNNFTSAGIITVTFGSSPNGTTAQGTAVLESTGIVTELNKSLSGFGYSRAPTITLEGGGGSGATAVGTIGGGEIVQIDVIAAGNNYSELSNVVIQNQDSTSARANLVIHYKIDSINLEHDPAVLAGTISENYTTSANIQFVGGLSENGIHAIFQPVIGHLIDTVVTSSGSNYNSNANAQIIFQGTTIYGNVTLDNDGNVTSVFFPLLNVSTDGVTPPGFLPNIVLPNVIINRNDAANIGSPNASITLVISGNTNITGYSIIDIGTGYISTPDVIINRNDANTGANVTATANIGYGRIVAINVLNPGSGGYSFTPNVTINKNNPLGGTLALAEAKIAALLNTVTITNPGSGYTSAPNVVITPAAGDNMTSNAVVTAVLGFELDRVNITNAGSGYSSVPSVTIGDTNSVTATATATVAFNTPLITNADNYEASHSAGGYGYGEFAAKYPGTLGNAIRVSVADANTYSSWQYANQFDSAPGTSAFVSSRGGSNDEMHIVVIDATSEWSGTTGTILERFSFVSKASDAKNSDGSSNYYKTVIANQSRYIWALDHPASTSNWGTASASKSFDQLSANITTTLAAGANGNEVSSANVATGYAVFANDELYDISLIPMGPVTNIGTVNSVIAIAETRRDAMVFVSPPYADVVNTTNQATKITDYRNSLTSSSYAVIDSGWKYQYDRYNDKYRYVPLNGDIAGLAARTDYIADPWFSPAGYNRGVIKNVVKLAYSPSKTDRDTLYKKGVNPVVTFPGQGTLLFGDKTLLARPSAFDRINVRRLFIVLEKAIATASKFQLFEFNDAFTRAQFRNLIEPFLRDVQGRRGITDFRVICDETNNTAEIIDRNEFVADIFIKPARAINFIQLNFIATRSGVSFEEVGA